MMKIHILLRKRNGDTYFFKAKLAFFRNAVEAIFYTLNFIPVFWTLLRERRSQLYI